MLRALPLEQLLLLLERVREGMEREEREVEEMDMAVAEEQEEADKEAAVEGTDVSGGWR